MFETGVLFYRLCVVSVAENVKQTFKSSMIGIYSPKFGTVKSTQLWDRSGRKAASSGNASLIVNFSTVVFLWSSIDRPTVFVGYSGRHQMGFGWNQQVRGQSWYNLIHYDDVFVARRKHHSRERAQTCVQYNTIALSALHNYMLLLTVTLTLAFPLWKQARSNWHFDIMYRMVSIRGRFFDNLV